MIWTPRTWPKRNKKRAIQRRILIFIKAKRLGLVDMNEAIKYTLIEDLTGWAIKEL